MFCGNINAVSNAWQWHYCDIIMSPLTLSYHNCIFKIVTSWVHKVFHLFGELYIQCECIELYDFDKIYAHILSK